MQPRKTIHSNASLNEQNSSGSGLKKKTPQPVSSGTRARNRRKAASTTKFGPGSSPPAPTPSGLTPDQPRVRRSSIQFPAQDGGVSPNTDSSYSEADEEMDVEIETPTRKPMRRARHRPSELTKPGGPSSPRQTLAPYGDVVADEDGIGVVRPRLASSYTSPEMHESTGRRFLRPNVTGRSVSDPVTPGKKLSGFQLDGDIAQLIKDGPKRDKGKEKEDGSIYLYRVKPRGSDVWLLKIGRTRKHARERLSQIKGVCGHLEIEEHTKAVARDIPFHGFAEKLIHTELSNYQHQWLCDCGRKHREYFLVSDDLAVKVFERWRDFCQEKPWDHSGKILPKWAQRLQNRAKFNGEERDFDHHEFARRWAAFTSPLSSERFLSDAIHVWKLGFPNRWLITSLAELLTIVCISRHSFWASAWTTIIVILLLADLMVTENMHTTAHIFQLMEGGLQSVSLRPQPPQDAIMAESEGPALENSPRSAPRQQESGETAAGPRERSAAAYTCNRNGIDTRQSMDGDNSGDFRGFTDDEDDWDGDARSPASVDTISTNKEGFNRRKSRDL